MEERGERRVLQNLDNITPAINVNVADRVISAPVAENLDYMRKRLSYATTPRFYLSFIYIYITLLLINLQLGLGIGVVVGIFSHLRSTTEIEQRNNWIFSK